MKILYKVVALHLFLFSFTEIVVAQYLAQVPFVKVSDNQYDFTITVAKQLPQYKFSVFVSDWEQNVDPGPKVIRIEVRQEGSNKILQRLHLPKNDDFIFNPRAVETKDMNFDGYNDILIEYNDGSAGGQNYVWLYNPKTGKYVFNDDFSELRDPDPDSVKHTITSYDAGGSTGGAVYTHCFKNGKLILLREVDTYNDFENKRSITTIKSYKNGKIISVKEDTTSF